RDDVAAEPVLPVIRMGFTHVDVELDIETHVAHRAPRETARTATLRAAEPFRETRSPTPHARAEAMCERHRAGLDERDPGRSAVAEHDDDGVHIAHRRLVPVEELLVENVANEVHVSGARPPEATDS